MPAGSKLVAKIPTAIALVVVILNPAMLPGITVALDTTAFTGTFLGNM